VVVRAAVSVACWSGVGDLGRRESRAWTIWVKACWDCWCLERRFEAWTCLMTPKVRPRRATAREPYGMVERDCWRAGSMG